MTSTKAEYKVYKLYRNYARYRRCVTWRWRTTTPARCRTARRSVTVQADGSLNILGDEMLWAVYNDADPANHTNRAGSTAPLGVEVQQTTFAFNRQGPLGNTIFIQYKLINKGANTIDSMYVSQWSDPDDGYAGDDLVGCDTTLSVGYVYNGTNFDNVYGAEVPAVGYDFFQGPIVGGTPLGMTSFNNYINGTDPNDFSKTYNLMKGLNADGTPLINPTTGLVTHYRVSGDPVLGSGWLDSNPSDRRLQCLERAVHDGARRCPGGHDRHHRWPEPQPAGQHLAHEVRGFAGPGGLQLELRPALAAAAAQRDGHAASMAACVSRGISTPSRTARPRTSGKATWCTRARRSPDHSPGSRRTTRSTPSRPCSTMISTSCRGSSFRPVRRFGTDAGLQYSVDLTTDAVRGGPLHNGTTYFFTLNAYAVGIGQVPQVLESANNVISVVPQTPAGGVDLASRQISSLTQGQRVAGPPPTTDVVTVNLVDPIQLKDASYLVGFKPTCGTCTTRAWYVVRTDGAAVDTVINNWTDFDADQQNMVVDGLQVTILSYPLGQLANVVYVDTTGGAPQGLDGAVGRGLAVLQRRVGLRRRLPRLRRFPCSAPTTMSRFASGRRARRRITTFAVRRTRSRTSWTFRSRSGTWMRASS